MIPRVLVSTEEPKDILQNILLKIHTEGPVKPEDLEALSYIKHFHPRIFSEEEPKLMYLLGLFYKIADPEDLLSLAYSIFSNSIEKETGHKFTPVQASIRKSIIGNRYFSFSAPTSAGKSYLFRELIHEELNDIVIVVPSRALIAEYMLTIREMVADRKDILVLQFIDSVNIFKTSRKIFVVTPERASDIFKSPEKYNPSLFLFDEAQISEEKIRGISFDSFVRQSDKIFPNSKKIFAHPFINNPQAQLVKHGYKEDSSSKAYQQNTVGKIFLGYDSKKDKFECFSPFIESPHLLKNKMDFNRDILEEKIKSGGSALIYISKASIYDKSFEKDFKFYIGLCDEITDPDALEIIDEIEDLIGAKERSSELVSLMKKGVVIHHGSVPLIVRFLIEKFTNLGFAKICFATSTLAQGVNMPFDIVWIENLRFIGSKEDQTLGIKNLIGRAGRSTNKKNSFDFGYVVVKNIKTFVERLNCEATLSEESQLDQSLKDVPDDLKEFVDAIKNDDIDQEYGLPNSKTERLKSPKARRSLKNILDFLFIDGVIMTGNHYRDLTKSKKKKLKTSLAEVFELSLGRKLYTGEITVLSASITILLWQIQGKTFKELLGFRYSYLTNQKEQRKIKRKVKSGEITPLDAQRQIEELPITYSAIPHSLPNSELKSTLPSRFRGSKMNSFNYDLVVYDTYDFLDKVISFSLSDLYIAAFSEYYIETADPRSRLMVNYFQYGTNDEIEIWLMRYGFSIEEAEIIKIFVDDINENEIVFSEKINETKNKNIKVKVEHYI